MSKGIRESGLDHVHGFEPGKLADLVVLRKNPLDDLRNTTAIRYVMKNGELFDADTLNELWPEKEAFTSHVVAEGSPVTSSEDAGY